MPMTNSPESSSSRRTSQSAAAGEENPLPSSSPKIDIIAERHTLDVDKAVLRGWPDKVYVDVCTKCGAIVFDVVKHDLFHTKWHKP